MTQETDQNYGLFQVSFAKEYTSVKNEEVSKYNEQQRLHHGDPATYTHPKKLPSLEPKKSTH
jgi:hypothetical protein